MTSPVVVRAFLAFRWKRFADPPYFQFSKLEDANSSINGRLWHKAKIRRSGIFRESGGALDLQDEVNINCHEVAN
ncbi:MAG: hypothetical protein ACK4NN_03140 [Rheinheimera sp.]